MDTIRLTDVLDVLEGGKKLIIVTKIAFAKYKFVFHCKWQNT